MFASKNGHLQTVRELVRLGAKPNIVNSSGMTAISFPVLQSEIIDPLIVKYISCAASEGHADVNKELVAPVSNVSELLQTKDTNGNTPLHFAAYLNLLLILQFIVTNKIWRAHYSSRVFAGAWGVTICQKQTRQNPSYGR